MGLRRGLIFFSWAFLIILIFFFSYDSGFHNWKVGPSPTNITFLSISAWLISFFGRITDKILNNSKWYKDVEELKNFLNSIEINNSDILIKGSRSFKLETLEKTIKQISVWYL